MLCPFVEIEYFKPSEKPFSDGLFAYMAAAPTAAAPTPIEVKKACTEAAYGAVPALVAVFGVFRICFSLLSQSIEFQKKFSFHFYEVDRPKLFFCPFFYWDFFIRITSISILLCITV